MALRQRLRTLGVEGAVTQRLKERPTIVRKLVRGAPQAQLSTMQDIAGARAVVDSIEDVRRLEEQLRKTAGDRINDYYDLIETPRNSGYRAIHFVMKHKGRLVEIQLRSRIQHRWAELVEDLGKKTGKALKNEEGPPELLDGLASLADTLANIDSRRDYPPEVRTETVEIMSDLREWVRRHGVEAS